MSGAPFEPSTATLAYYERCAEEYVAQTRHADMRALHEAFLARVAPGGAHSRPGLWLGARQQGIPGAGLRGGGRGRRASAVCAGGGLFGAGGGLRAVRGLPARGHLRRHLGLRLALASAGG